mmetsp:Transcript_106178/g.269684  ORF Transcript_106178/g.269684 Transcript_106178/m.269684 type:complete len:274 (-) Transcript_106178:505-1326(-)
MPEQTLPSTLQPSPQPSSGRSSGPMTVVPLCSSSRRAASEDSTPGSGGASSRSTEAPRSSMTSGSAKSWRFDSSVQAEAALSSLPSSMAKHSQASAMPTTAACDTSPTAAISWARLSTYGPKSKQNAFTIGSTSIDVHAYGNPQHLHKPLGPLARSGTICEPKQSVCMAWPHCGTKILGTVAGNTSASAPSKSPAEELSSKILEHQAQAQPSSRWQTSRYISNSSSTSSFSHRRLKRLAKVRASGCMKPPSKSWACGGRSVSSIIATRTADTR